jgi:hypothetical protein
MDRVALRAGIRQFLPVLTLFLAAGFAPAAMLADEPIGEGGSKEPEPGTKLSESGARNLTLPVSRSRPDSKDPLVKLVWETREVQRKRMLSTKDHTPWQIMHGVLGLRQDLQILHNGEPVSGLDWVRSGPQYQNEHWFEKTVHGGRAHPYIKPYWFEGHVNQFLAVLSMCNLPLDTKFGTASGVISMRDMLKNAQMTVNAREEVTWTLWGLATYLPSDASWVNAEGEQWSIEKLVQLETGKPVGGATSPCGGTHGLFALARARNVYLRTGQELKGVWFEADRKVKRYIEVARVLRNSDGSLSSGFFKTREYKQDYDKRMASQGHLLEFLMMSVSQEELKQQWVRRAIECVANDLMANRREDVSCSPLYHSLNALSIYLDRVALEEAEAKKATGQEVPTKSISQTRELPAAVSGGSAPAMAVSPAVSGSVGNSNPAAAAVPAVPVPGGGAVPSPAGVSPSPAGVSPSPTGVSPVPTGVSPVPAGVSPSPAGVSPSPAGVSPVPAGVSSSPTGVSPAPTGVSPAPTGVSPAPTGVSPSPAGVSPTAPAEGARALAAPGSAVPAVPVAFPSAAGEADFSGGLSDQFLMEFIGELPWSGAMRPAGGASVPSGGAGGAGGAGGSDEALDLQSFMDGAEPVLPGPLRGAMPERRGVPVRRGPVKVRPPLRQHPRVMTVSGQSE